MQHETQGQATQVIHGGHIRDEHGSLSSAIYQTSTFVFPSVESVAQRYAQSDGREGFIYSRWGNPTTLQLEDKVALLEGGVGALACASGCAAINTAFFALLGQGQHIVIGRSLYGPTALSMREYWPRFGVEPSFIDTTDPDAVRAALRPETTMLYIETPSNPAQKITDIAACAEIAHSHGALLVIDNTPLSPILQRPLQLGADLVIHSTTKAINGHCDVIGGMLVFGDAELQERVRDPWRTFGATMDPHQAWLTLRGAKTMRLRVVAAQQNAQAVAEFLAEHPAIERVNYAGLPSHPGYELHRSQADGPGANMSFVLAGGLEAGRSMLSRVKLASLGVSLGGVETLIQHPASMTHHSMPREQRLKADIPDGLVRLSVGCEDSADIIADLRQALDA